MPQCPYCGCDALVKNGSTRGVPKWKCKKCGRQTSLKGEKGEKDQGKAETVLLSLSALSLNAIACLTSVVPSTVLRRVRRCAEQWATKPRPGPGGVIVMELDELWHFLKTKPTNCGSRWLSVGTPGNCWMGNAEIVIKPLSPSFWTD